LIAQEVERVFPELVGEEGHGFKAVNYSELPLLLLAAVRELKAENDALRRQQQTELAALRAQRDRLAVLEAELAELKSMLRHQVERASQ
jgi:predicted nuclease with TOPRIM domain